MQIYLYNSLFFCIFAAVYYVHMTKLSFIVPFYGVEKYIEECIRSLYDQDISMEEYEVICVDDCSPDGSRAIVERLQREYPTLRLLTHTENKRQGGARNTGMREAKGKYVWFVDSDDYIEANCLNAFLSAMDRDNLDILQFDYKRISKGVIHVHDKEVGIIRGEEYLFDDKGDKWIEKVNGPWLQIFRRDFLEQNQIIFAEHFQYEDTDYMLKAFLRAERVRYVKQIGYHYRLNEESTTKSKTPIKLAWMVNQLTRCYGLISQARLLETKSAIETFVNHTLSSTRLDIKKLDAESKRTYLAYIDKKGIDACRDCMTWKTRMAIRYAITMFV